MFAPQTLRKMAYPERFAVWGLPAVWWVVFVQSVSPFLNATFVAAFVLVYIGLVALWGTLRPLKFPPRVQERLERKSNCKQTLLECTIRVANTLCDAACAALSLFFLSKINVLQPMWFPPLFIFSLSSHCFVEIYVDALLRSLHDGNRKTFGGRQFQPEEIEQLVTVEAVKT